MFERFREKQRGLDAARKAEDERRAKQRKTQLHVLWAEGCSLREEIATYLGIIQWPADESSVHESFGRALSFLIKSIITLDVSATQHALNFFSVSKKGNRHARCDLLQLQTTVQRGLILF
jgi:hypothetical protein